jgi:hypothetical protein
VRERTYTGIFRTGAGRYVRLDFYATNVSLARDHAHHVAFHPLDQRFGSDLAVIKVRNCPQGDFLTAGDFTPCTLTGQPEVTR